MSGAEAWTDHERATQVGRLLHQARRLIATDPSVADAFLVQAVELLPNAPGAPSSDTTAGLAPWQVKRVNTLIEERMQRRLNTPQMAAAVGLSASHFSRAFRKTHGVPPQTLILLRRIERAGHLILTTSDPLSDVALACGFFDQAHLSRAFRRQLGQAPAAWRRKHRATSS